MIDNYDSFTYNLYQCLGSFGKEVKVARNDELALAQIREMKPEKIVLSPGPGNPENRRDFGVCADVLSGMVGTPILGVCLGHQGIISHFGGKVVKNKPMHGKTSMIEHNGKGIFEGVKSPFRAMRYHSLVGAQVPDCLEITATSMDDRQVMAVAHKSLPIYGVQFHPESIMTEEGMKIIGNFLKL
ncbi:MAG TPA: aminodeoxychorismate/anthranilate synthase component II [Candidatus Micrarchaeota archaeon]|nr:aminodeoxychorismate/anthranilate synthase component II [Candidatus Micrarchaeota archaeon]